MQKASVQKNCSPADENRDHADDQKENQEILSKETLCRVLESCR